MTSENKALELKDKFGSLANKVIYELLENNEECMSRYRTNNDRVCIRQYWLDVRNELSLL